MCLDVCANDEGSLSTSFINKKNTYLKFLKIKSFNIIQYYIVFVVIISIIKNL